MLREDLYLYSDKRVSDNFSRSTVHRASLTAVSRIHSENVEVLHNLIIRTGVVFNRYVSLINLVTVTLVTQKLHEFIITSKTII